MNWERYYRILQPETAGSGARAFRFAHHAMVVLGIAVMLADTVELLRAAHQRSLDIAFQIVCAFFIAEYLARLAVAPEAPTAHHRGWRARLSWMASGAGLFNLLGALPGVLDVVFNPKAASLYGFVWAFKPVRYSSGLASLQRVISRARHALLSVLLGFGIVLLLAASLAYLLENKAQPEFFGSIPQALWWAIVTMTTTGYGDVVPMTCRPDGCLPASSWSAASSSSHCGPAFSPAAMPRNCGAASFCGPGISSPRCRFSKTSALRSSPMSPGCCGRAIIQRGPSCAPRRKRRLHVFYRLRRG